MRVSVQACLIAVALCALVLAPPAAVAQADSGKDAAPSKSRTVRITTQAPEPNKWLSARSSNGLKRIFKCKPLACLSPTTVTFDFQKGSFTPPDREALERLANVDLPKSIRAVAAAQADMANRADTIETLASTTATLKNYPAVLNETKISQAKTSVYVEIAIIFASPVIVRIEAKSTSRGIAQKSLNQFVEAMRIEEGPAPSAPSPAHPSKSQNL
jgi:hypothetical protein